MISWLAITSAEFNGDQISPAIRNGGIIVRAASETYVEDVTQIPNQFTLHQNFPNPFNHSTKISFNLKKSGHTELIVYNIMGAKVITLVNGFVESGYHEYVFDSKQLSSGIYYYRLVNENESQTRKLVLIK